MALQGTRSLVKALTQKDKSMILIGKKTRGDLKILPHDIWFKENYNRYEGDGEVLQKLRPLLAGVTVTIVIGTWCPDCHTGTPAFYKIMDGAGFDEKNITLITVDRGFKGSEDVKEALALSKLPTIVFFREGRELGRIIETPTDSFEKDMLGIVEKRDKR